MNWLKNQSTEISAWAGLALILSPVFPNWVAVMLGILAISIDDKKAASMANASWAWLTRTFKFLEG